jgi:hypothetical protein
MPDKPKPASKKEYDDLMRNINRIKNVVEAPGKASEWLRKKARSGISSIQDSLTDNPENTVAGPFAANMLEEAKEMFVPEHEEPIGIGSASMHIPGVGLVKRVGKSIQKLGKKSPKVLEGKDAIAKMTTPKALQGEDAAKMRKSIDVDNRTLDNVKSKVMKEISDTYDHDTPKLIKRLKGEIGGVDLGKASKDELKALLHARLFKNDDMVKKITNEINKREKHVKSVTDKHVPITRD